MKFGHELIEPLCEALLAFMEKHKFATLEDFRGHSWITLPLTQSSSAVMKNESRPGKAPPATVASKQTVTGATKSSSSNHPP
jgi:hypothetical protein